MLEARKKESGARRGGGVKPVLYGSVESSGVGPQAHCRNVIGRAGLPVNPYQSRRFKLNVASIAVSRLDGAETFD